MTMDLTQYQQPEIIQAALSQRRIAVVGMSANHLRASYFVGFYLQRHGYQVIPVNPRESEILGQVCYPSVTEIPEPPEVINVFRDPAAVPGIAEEAVAVGAKYLWLQFGVISETGAAIAEAGGVQVIMDRCIKVEHARYRGRMHWLGFNTEQISAQRA
mgnify:CR=1 FL=1